MLPLQMNNYFSLTQIDADRFDPNSTFHYAEVRRHEITDLPTWKVYVVFMAIMTKIAPFVAIILMNIMIFVKLRQIWSKKMNRGRGKIANS